MYSSSECPDGAIIAAPAKSACTDESTEGPMLWPDDSETIRRRSQSRLGFAAIAVAVTVIEPPAQQEQAEGTDLTTEDEELLEAA